MRRRFPLLTLLSICVLATIVTAQGTKINGPVKVAGASNIGGAFPMPSVVSDDFNRPNGNLGSYWVTPVPIVNAEGVMGGASSGIQLVSDSYAMLDNFAGLAVAPWTTGSFGNDQWAQASISAIAPMTSIVAITAASQSGSNTTYTYTLSSGDALIMGQQIYVQGMAHAGNNSTVGFLITGLGAGTFTVVNASGVTATESGVGTSPSDSNVGLVIRGTLNGLNGYYINVGTNSGQVGSGGTGSIDQRVYDIEIWKLISGNTTLLSFFTPTINSVTDTAGGVYTFATVGNTLYVYYNGLLKVSTTDNAIASGIPGIMTWGIKGAGEWSNPTFYDTGTGNSGTRWTHWVAGDFKTTNIPVFDNFIAANGTDLHTYKPKWVENDGTMQIQSNTVTYNTLVSNNALASWQGATFANDQWAQVTISTFVGNSFLGPAVRIDPSLNTGYFYRQNTTNDRVLFKVVNNVFTLLATSNTAHVNARGDVLKLVVIGTNLYCFLNGVLENFGVISDSSLTSGFPGIQGANNTSGTGTLATGYMAGNASIGGNAGISGATITLGGAGSGTTVSDLNGVYSFNSGIVDGTYTLTPSLAGHTFSPSSLTVVVTGATVFPIGENFSVQ